MIRLAALVTVIAVPLLAAGEQPLELKTQFGKQIDIFAGDQPRLVVYSDRDGAAHAGAWLDATRDGPCRVLEAANLGAAPLIARPFVRGAFRDASPVLLDWNAELADALGFEPDRANIYLIDDRGRLHTHLAGRATPERLSVLEQQMHEVCRVLD